MIFHIITIFPEAFNSFLSTSIIGRAKKNGLFEVKLYDLGDFSSDRFRRVDDKAYGMHGQVLSPKPLARCLDSILQQFGKDIPVIYFSPSGKKLTQARVEKYQKQSQNYILICGHYEGIDQRIIDMYVTEKISLGDYVISGGELAAQVFVDALTRHIPGVLGNQQSVDEESFSKKLFRKKEYPVYTRPELFNGRGVPKVLLSGNHEQIEKWKIDNLNS